MIGTKIAITAALVTYILTMMSGDLDKAMPDALRSMPTAISTHIKSAAKEVMPNQHSLLQPEEKKPLTTADVLADNYNADISHVPTDEVLQQYYADSKIKWRINK